MRTPEELERLKKLRDDAAKKTMDLITQAVETILAGKNEDGSPNDEELAQLLGVSYGAWAASRKITGTLGLDAWQLSDEMTGGVSKEKLEEIINAVVLMHQGGMKN
jgi:hypothetical protein